MEIMSKNFKIFFENVQIDRELNIIKKKSYAKNLHRAVMQSLHLRSEKFSAI